MVGKEFKSRFGAAVIAAAMAFSSLSGALPGGKAFAEENAATDVLAVQDKEEERITVSGNILNAKKAQIFEIEFYSSFSWDEDDWDDDGVCREDVVVVVAKDGKYSAQLERNRNYYVDVRLGGDNIWIKDPDNDDDGVLVKTQEEDMTFNFEIVEAFNCNIEGDVVSDFDRSDLLEVLDGASVIISGEEYSKTVKLSKNKPYFDVGEVPVGSYDITLKGKTGNTYCVQPFTFEYGYGVDGPPEEVILDASYGNYEDRDFNGRVICSFADLTAADYSDVDFYFVDSYNNRSGKYSYLELKCGLVWLPNDETYTLVAEGLPEGIDLNYDKMGDINLTEDYCNDTYYNYTVSVGKAEANDRVTVNGKITDYTITEPMEILFQEQHNGDAVRTVTTDGQFSVELKKNTLYYVYLPNAVDYALLDWQNEGIYVNTNSDEAIELDFSVISLQSHVEGTLHVDSDVDILEFTDDLVIVFENEKYSTEVETSDDYFDVLVPTGEYTVTVKNKNGHVYSAEPMSFCYNNYMGNVDMADIDLPFECDIDISYGDYRKRDIEARIICDFTDAEDLDISKVSFCFVDSDNNRTSDYSYLELKAGLVRLPKDKSYKLVASGLPQGVELDYDKMGDIHPTKDHCEGGHYDYLVATKKANAEVPLSIVNDTEDIVAKNGSKATFKIEAEGTGLKYSWYYKKPGATKYTKAGVYVNEYTRTAGKSTDGMQAYCVVTDAKGAKVTGRVATLTVEKKAEITYPLGKELSAAKGAKVNFQIAYTSEDKATYNWYYMIPATSGGDGKYHKAGCYTDTYTRTAGNKIDGMKAYCLITDSTGHQVKSDVITFNLKK